MSGPLKKRKKSKTSTLPAGLELEASPYLLAKYDKVESISNSRSGVAAAVASWSRSRKTAHCRDRHLTKSPKIASCDQKDARKQAKEAIVVQHGPNQMTRSPSNEMQTRDKNEKDETSDGKSAPSQPLIVTDSEAPRAEGTSYINELVPNKTGMAMESDNGFPTPHSGGCCTISFSKNRVHCKARLGKLGDHLNPPITTSAKAAWLGIMDSFSMEKMNCTNMDGDIASIFTCVTVATEATEQF